MDRQIIYPGQIPLETDLLNTNKNTMVALGKLIAAVFGTSTFVSGLACVPTGPASLNVQVNPGEIYSLQNIDGTAYSSLAADTTHQIMKQGMLLDAVTLACAAPATAGQSINYLIQATYQDSDTGLVALPYYNASNPAQAYSGPNNSGTQQATARKGVVTISAKAGIAATTGTQTTPAPDAGYVGLWVVTVANGQTQITVPNIVQAAGAPFFGQAALLNVLNAFTVSPTAPTPTQFDSSTKVATTEFVQRALTELVPHGQCRLVKSGANLVLQPFNGNSLVVAGVQQRIPAAGVSLAPAGLLASTVYYIYAYMNGSALALEASPTGHSTDADTGVEIKTSDATRTLVGMARTIAGPAWQDTPSQRFIASYFNRPARKLFTVLASNASTASSAWVELSASSRLEWVQFADEMADATLALWTSPPPTAGLDAKMGVGIDGAVSSEGFAEFESGGASTMDELTLSQRAVFAAGAGYHYASMYGAAPDSASVTFYSNGSSFVGCVK